MHLKSFQKHNITAKYLLCGDDDWAEPGWPSLDEKYCYLLHDLLGHSHLSDRVFEIGTIWFDIKMWNQDAIKIFPDGKSVNDTLRALVNIVPKQSLQRKVSVR